MIKKTISSILIIIFLAVGILWFMDYDRVKKGFEPKYCLKEEVYTYKDGETKLCRGPGYNVIRYNRTSNKKIVVGPFWFKVED